MVCRVKPPCHLQVVGVAKHNEWLLLLAIGLGIVVVHLSDTRIALDIHITKPKFNKLLTSSMEMDKHF